MKDVKPAGKTVRNFMVRVKCPKFAVVAPANNSRGGPRCTKCGETGHEAVQ